MTASSDVRPVIPLDQTLPCGLRVWEHISISTISHDISQEDGGLRLWELTSAWRISAPISGKENMRADTNWECMSGFYRGQSNPFFQRLMFLLYAWHCTFPFECFCFWFCVVISAYGYHTTVSLRVKSSVNKHVGLVW